MNTSIKICLPVLQRDYEQAVEIIEKTLLKDETTNPDYFQKFAVGEILVAKEDEKVVGVLVQYGPGKVFKEFSLKHFTLKKISTPKGKIGYISFLAVDPEYHRRGIGKNLIKKALKYQKDFGATAVGVHCWQASPGGGSEKVFRACGFEPVKMHESAWYEESKKLGPEGYWCVVCGNPCKCDELEMVRYL